MTPKDALTTIRRALGSTGYLTQNTKAPRDPDERRANQEQAATLRNEIQGIRSSMIARTRMIQAADATYQAMHADLTNTEAALKTAEAGAAWRYAIGFRYRGAILQVTRLVAQGTTCQHAIDNMHEVIRIDPTISNRATQEGRQRR
ncbi:MAG TPA: hypothetical protein VM487_05090 [Phycisphaerae bacterium]|nr:hypothetical protein [Phycisphaerae bacterium]